MRLYSRPGNDLTERFPLIVEALREKQQEGEQGAAHGLAPYIVVGISALASGLLYLSKPTL